MTISVLVIGEIQRAEAIPLMDWITTSLQPSDVRFLPQFSNEWQSLSDIGWMPDLVIVLQGWSDEYSASDVECLLSWVPLARIVVCYGAWCESDGRNRSIWPLAVRVAMTTATSRIRREWKLLNGESVQVPLPLSASRDEIFEADHPQLTSSPRRLVGIDSPDCAYRDFLLELLNGAGVEASIVGQAVVQSPTGHRREGGGAVVDGALDAILFDADPPGLRRREALKGIREQCPDSPIVVLTTSPSSADIDELMESGAANVITKLGDQQRILDAVLFAEPGCI